MKYWLTFNEINNQMNTDSDLFGWMCSGVRFSQQADPRQVKNAAGGYTFKTGDWEHLDRKSVV